MCPEAQITYICSFRGFSGATSLHITKPLTFHQRRLMAKTRLGCLPIRLETGRYSIPRLPESERKCQVCKAQNQLVDVANPSNAAQPIESETHFLFYCGPYKAERDLWYSNMNLPADFDLLPVESKLQVVLNDPHNVKLSAQFITNAYNIRSKILK